MITSGGDVGDGVGVGPRHYFVAVKTSYKLRTKTTRNEEKTRIGVRANGAISAVPRMKGYLGSIRIGSGASADDRRQTTDASVTRATEKNEPGKLFYEIFVSV